MDNNKTVAVSNTGSSPIFVGGYMIPPGETRIFSESQVPPEYLKPAVVADEPAPFDPLGDFLTGKADAVKVGIPALSDNELARAEVLEAEGKARKGVLEAIAAEKLARAEKAAGGAGGEGGGE